MTNWLKKSKYTTLFLILIFWLTACDTLDDSITYLLYSQYDKPIQAIHVDNEVIWLATGENWQNGKVHNLSTDSSFDISNTPLWIFQENNKIWAGGINSNLYNLDSTKMWTKIEHGTYDMYRSMAVCNDVKFIIGGKSHKNGFILMLDDLGNITKRWNIPQEMRACTCRDSTLIISGYGAAYALDVLTQDTLDKLNLEGDFFTTQILSKDNLMIVGQEGKIYALNQSSNEWTSSKIRNNSHRIMTGTIHKNTIYLAGDNGMIWVKKPASDSWESIRVGNYHFTTINVYKEKLLLGSMQGSLISVDLL